MTIAELRSKLDDLAEKNLPENTQIALYDDEWALWTAIGHVRVGHKDRTRGITDDEWYESSGGEHFIGLS